MDLKKVHAGMIILAFATVSLSGITFWLYNDSISLKRKIAEFERQQSYMADVQLADYDWTQYPQGTEKNLYYVEVSLTLVNYGNSSAFVEIAFSMHDLDGNVIREFFKTGEHSGSFIPVHHTERYLIGAETTGNYGFSFSYQKPQDTDTYLKVIITEVLAI